MAEILIGNRSLSKRIPHVVSTPTLVDFEALLSHKIEHCRIGAYRHFVDLDDLREIGNFCRFQRVIFANSLV